jgi:hypothetical protein
MILRGKKERLENSQEKSIFANDISVGKNQ